MIVAKNELATHDYNIIQFLHALIENWDRQLSDIASIRSDN